jgi:hypothetical protein
MQRFILMYNLNFNIYPPPLPSRELMYPSNSRTVASFSARVPRLISLIFQLETVELILRAMMYQPPEDYSFCLLCCIAPVLS